VCGIDEKARGNRERACVRREHARLATCGEMKPPGLRQASKERGGEAWHGKCTRVSAVLLEADGHPIFLQTHNYEPFSTQFHCG
jgi:hypothetical protein